MEKLKFEMEKNQILHLIGPTMIEIIFLPDIKFFSIFFNFSKKKITAGQKTTQKFPDLHSQILLNKYHFFQFSTHHRHTTWCGKF